jgi:hypothetical protein
MLPRLPTSIAAVYLSAYLQTPFYNTIKRYCFQANYPVCSSNIMVFSIKRAVQENLLRSLAFICRNCYTRCDIEDWSFISGSF